jgi:[ribosomal protein S5]-alanine N-acetyltransferase
MKLVEIGRDGAISATDGTLPEITQSVIESTVQLYSRMGWTPPWIGYLGFEGNECVGTCAFTGPPKDGAVEIAYFTLPGREGTGVATRMAAQLVSIARLSAPEISVTAHTLPRENASTRILRKLGFEFMGPAIHAEDGQIWIWRYEEKTSQPIPTPNPKC